MLAVAYLPVTLLGHAAHALVMAPFGTVATWQLLRQTDSASARRHVTNKLGWRALWQGAALAVPLVVADAYFDTRLKAEATSASTRILTRVVFGITAGVVSVTTVGLLTAQRHQCIYAYAWERRRQLLGVVLSTAPFFMGMFVLSETLNQSFHTFVMPWLQKCFVPTQVLWSFGVVMLNVLLQAPMNLVLVHRASHPMYNSASQRYSWRDAWTGTPTLMAGIVLGAVANGLMQSALCKGFVSALGAA